MRKLRIQPPVVDADGPAPRLPQRTPGANLHLILDELTRERDELEGAEMAASQRADQAEKEADQLAGERDEAIVGRDELAAVALPLYGGPVEPTKDHVDALIFNELCEELDFLPDLVIEDAADLPERIREFGREYAGWV